MNVITQNKRKFLLGLVTFAAIVVGTIGVANIGSAQAATSTPCIVTLFGKQYDVTSLQSPTPGGTFACGTDMSAVYQSVHGTDVTMMLPYLVPDPTTTPVPTVTPSPTMTPDPTVTPTTTPDPTITPSPTETPTVAPLPVSVGSESDDADEVGEEAEENNRQTNGTKTEKNDSRGHHLVGANSAHGIMDNTLKKRED